MWTPTYVYELINFIGNKQTEQKIVRIPSSRRFQSTKGFCPRPFPYCENESPTKEVDSVE